MKSKTDLSKEDLELIEAAKEAADRLHINDVHEVAAAVRTRDKKIFTGIHIEANVGFADVCGEVAAICTAVSQGYRNFETIVAIWGDGKGNYELPSPCGRCREIISDFNKDTWVIVGSLEHPYKVRILDLLPLKYKPSGRQICSCRPQKCAPMHAHFRF
ncbi:MAG: cytidine deaminase [Candidatus Bathyarchaeota archaeon]|nr:cytidine deaminase [Candidatus Bathyarchaeota archaeon]